MTKLEEEIAEAMECQESRQTTDLARMAAIVAKKYIEGALESCARLTNMLHSDQHGDFENVKRIWLKENGIIE